MPEKEAKAQKTDSEFAKDLAKFRGKVNDVLPNVVCSKSLGEWIKSDPKENAPAAKVVGSGINELSDYAKNFIDRQKARVKAVPFLSGALNLCTFGLLSLGAVGGIHAIRAGRPMDDAEEMGS